MTHRRRVKWFVMKSFPSRSLIYGPNKNLPARWRLNDPRRFTQPLQSMSTSASTSSSPAPPARQPRIRHAPHPYERHQPPTSPTAASATSTPAPTDVPSSASKSLRYPVARRRKQYHLQSNTKTNSTSSIYNRISAKLSQKV